MGLEQQLQFPFMIDIEREEKKQKRIEGYKDMATAGAILGTALTLIPLTDHIMREGLMNQPYIALMNVGGGSLVFIVGEYLINKFEESKFYNLASYNFLKLVSAQKT